MKDGAIAPDDEHLRCGALATSQPRFAPWPGLAPLLCLTRRGKRMGDARLLRNGPFADGRLTIYARLLNSPLGRARAQR